LCSHVRFSCADPISDDWSSSKDAPVALARDGQMPAGSPLASLDQFKARPKVRFPAKSLVAEESAEPGERYRVARPADQEPAGAGAPNHALLGVSDHQASLL